MTGYKITCPNIGTQYAKDIKGVIDTLNKDGFDWGCRPQVFAFMMCGEIEYVTQSLLAVVLRHVKPESIGLYASPNHITEEGLSFIIEAIDLY